MGIANAPRVTPPLFSRIMTIAAVSACVGAAAWISLRVFEPVSVPPAPPVRARVIFSEEADVSRNAVFLSLTPLGPSEVVSGELGRVNPFVPPVAPSSTDVETRFIASQSEAGKKAEQATSSKREAVSSTEQATD